MTREEEIFYDLDSQRPQSWEKYEKDIMFLLARNEELQREKEKMQAVVVKARALGNTIGNPFAQHAMLHAALPHLIDNLQAELNALDAKEPDDD